MKQSTGRILSAFAVFIVLLISAAVFAQPDGEGQNPNWSESTLSDLGQNVQVAVPAGVSGRLVFSIRLAGVDRIVSLDLDTKRLQPLIGGPGNSTYPAWSPDGRRLAFVSDRDGKRQIYLADWQGLGARRVSKDSFADDLPAWSADGTQLAYHVEEKTGGDSNIWIANPQGGTAKQLTRLKGRNLYPAWSALGERIFYLTNRFWPGWRLCAAHTSSGAEECLTGESDVIYAFLAPNVSGQELYTCRIEDTTHTITAINLSTMAAHVILKGEDRIYDPTPWGDGKRIAYVARNQGSEYRINMAERSDKDPVIKPLLISPYPIKGISWSTVKSIQLEAERLKQLEAAAAEATAAATAAETAVQPEATAVVPTIAATP